ncbi:MAG: hypothetical protein ACQEP0_05150 [Natrinema limicola]
MGERIHLVVSEGQKEDWEEFVGKTDGVDTLSDLIRTSVADYIGRAQSESDVPETIEDMFDDIQSDFAELKANIRLSNDVLQSIEEEQLDSDRVEDIVNFHTGLILDELEEIESKTAEGGDDE